jgi:hypothetical protein
LIKSRLYQALQQLDGHERNAFGQWMHSPFFNQDERLLRLWKYLEECLAYDLPPDKYKAFKAASSDKAYKESQGNLLNSRLYKQLEQFLSYREWQQHPFEQQRLLLDGLRKHHLGPHHKTAHRNAEQFLQKQPFRTAKYFHQQLELKEEAHRQISRERPTDASHLREMAGELDAYYLLRQLQYSCLILAHRSVYKQNYQLSLIDHIVPLLKDGAMLNIPAVAVYYNCYQMLSAETDTEFYHRFRQLLVEHAELFPKEELRDLLLIAINYAVRQVNSGNQSYYEEINKLYKLGLSSDSLLDEGRLSRFTYQNIVIAALRTQDFEWAEDFLYQYRSALGRTYRDAVFSYGKAQLAYYTQQFGQALELLQKANYRDPLHNLGAKTLLLKIYYETDETETLLSHLDAMEQYIRRKTVIGYHRTNYLNIVKYTRALASLNPYDKEARVQLFHQMQKEEVLTEREWLTERCM